VFRARIFSSVSQASRATRWGDIKHADGSDAASKAWGHFFVPEKLEICLDHVLRNTGLDYIDLFLVHFPVALKPISDEALLNARSGHDATHVDKGIAKENDRPFVDWAHTSAPIAKKAGQQGSFVPTWQAMQALVKTGKCRAVGVSNFSIADIEELLPYSKEIPISCNQVEVHPWLPQTELIEFCRKHDILVTCYSPFAGQKKDGKTLLKDEKVLKLAEKNSMDVGQILQSWAVQRGTSPLGKSATSSRIKSNLAVRKLSEEDFQALNDLKLEGDEGRTVNPSEEWGATLY
jgi:glycerol 2-dehydrogenase (NADP+)